jgi:DNA adenine methylase
MMGMRPLLRWAGGKRWLVPRLTELLEGVEFQNYHEPFAGGAAVFFGLACDAKAYLSDLNSDLIETYEQVREHPDEVWRVLQNYRNTEAEYYAARATTPLSAVARAARFIFLNHASFNGIYRVNLAGVYNVPYGYRTSYNPPTLEDLRQASLRLQSAVLISGDFSDALANVGPGDLVFLDPPYTTAHANNGFVKYNDRLFRFSDQFRLAEMVKAVRGKGAYYVLTNGAHSSIAEIFECGDLRMEIYRRSAVGGRSAARGRAAEYLFTNLSPS